MASGHDEPWVDSEREVEAQAAKEPRDPITEAETLETEVMEELTEEEEEAQKQEKRGRH